jgi:hypothetical protein
MRINQKDLFGCNALNPKRYNGFCLGHIIGKSKGKELKAQGSKLKGGKDRLKHF